MRHQARGMSSVRQSAQTTNVCPSCIHRGMTVFYEVKSIPIHGVLLLPTREEALNYPTGDMTLGFCQACGFIANLAFDPSLHEYSLRYESTQGFSSTFSTFHRRLAEQLVQRHNLQNKQIIEIGCGAGEFLTLLCELGGNRGTGFDPVYVSERSHGEARDRVTFIKDFFSEKYASYHGDFVCCKLTIEHIQHTRDFVSMVRRSIGERYDTLVFFQVPNVTRILREVAFWDIYYEHCSYFTQGSLARLFQHCGFDVVDLFNDYDTQYVMLEARRSHPNGTSPGAPQDDLEALAGDVAFFAAHYPGRVQSWRRRVQQMHQSGKRAVLWGGGSKGVAFLTTLNLHQEIDYVVDINPHKQGMYMVGTGQEIVAPEFLRGYRPDVVIVMNAIYREEIQQQLKLMGLTPELITL
jgi:SAM-dependent methyltransferase